MRAGERRSSPGPQVYKQKVKHLLYEHQNSLMEMKAEGTVVMKLAQKEHRVQEGTLCRDVRALKVGLKEQELASEVAVKNLRLVGTGLAVDAWGFSRTGNSYFCIITPAFWQLNIKQQQQ